MITIIKNNLKYEYKQQHKNENTLFFTTLINFSKGLRYTSYLDNMSENRLTQLRSIIGQYITYLEEYKEKPNVLQLIKSLKSISSI